MEEDCVFCRVAAGEKEEYIVHEDGGVVAFLNKQQITPGHLLIIPREHYDTFTQLPTAVRQELVAAAQTLTDVVVQETRADGVTWWQNNGYGQTVRHHHLHLLPRYGDDPFEEHVVPAIEKVKQEHLLSPDEKHDVAAQLREGL